MQTIADLTIEEIPELMALSLFKKREFLAENDPDLPTNIPPGGGYYLGAKNTTNEYIGLISACVIGPGIANITKIAVLPTHRHQGIGSNLIHAICTYLAQKASLVILINGIYAKLNESINNFFKKNGFVPYLIHPNTIDPHTPIPFWIKLIDPPLKQLIHTDNAARSAGITWPNLTTIIEDTISECTEIQQALEEKEPNWRIQEEIGDLLQAAVAMCLFARFDVEETISLVNKKFSQRINILKDIATKQGITNLQHQPKETIKNLWQAMKQQVKQAELADQTTNPFYQTDQPL